MKRILSIIGISTLLGTQTFADDTADSLISAMLGETPVLADLQTLTDEIGGRVTGSDAGSAAIAWALETFEKAGVTARAEAFEMPYQWQEVSATARIDGATSFSPTIVAKPFSAAADAIRAPLIDAGTGSAEEFSGLGESATDAWLLVETPVLDDVVGLGGLFAEYASAATIEEQASDAGAAGIVFMSSRPGNLMYRLPILSAKHRQPVILMEREGALRAQRILRDGESLFLTASVKLSDEYGNESSNVIAEIKGSDRPQEIVLFGAHLDSHDLGTGALDNGANVTMLIDIARQIRRLGLVPKRTIRFALWNGEEQGLVGSWRYTEQHADELDDHVVATSFDIGTGQILGFFTGGLPALVPLVDEALVPVAGMGPFQQVDVPLVGTDNFDFMMQGVPNLIAMQADANYASNYHASSDTFEKVDQRQLKLNSAIAAALIWGFANSDDRAPRSGRTRIVELVRSTDLEQQMRNFGVWQDWVDGKRGRQR